MKSPSITKSEQSLASVKKFPQIHSNEWRRVCLLAGLIIIVTTIPYLIGLLMQNDEWIFSGLLFGAEDGQDYLGRIRLGGQGQWVANFFYTSEPHDGIPLLYFFYLLPGHILGLFFSSETMDFRNGMLIVYHLLRIIGILAYTVTAFYFISYFIANKFWRYSAMLLLLLGGGFGWVVLFAGMIPLEFYVPEAFSIIIIAGLPHILFTRSATFAGILLLFKALDSESNYWWRWSVGAGFLWSLTVLAVPLYLITLFVAIVIWGVLSWYRWRKFPLKLTIRTSIAVLATLPVLLYLLYSFSQNDVYLQWKSLDDSTSNSAIQLPSPSIFIFLLSYGLLIALASIGIKWIWMKHPHLPHLFLIAWIVAPPLLIYIPFSDQRRLLEGAIVPLTILAILGLRIIILTHIKTPHRQKLLRTQVIFWSSLSSMFFIIFILYIGVFSIQSPLYIERPKADALLWLGQNSEDDSVMLAEHTTSNQTPSLANLRLFIGHSIETIHHPAKQDLVSSLYCDELLPDERHVLYQKYRIDYVFYGVAERELANEQEASSTWQEELELIYDENGYQIFRVPSELKNLGSDFELSASQERELACGDQAGLELLYEN